MVAISYGKGVVVCEKYDKMNGRYFSSFVRRKFNQMFEMSGKESSKIFTMNGDPSQNAKQAQAAIKKM